MQTILQIRRDYETACLLFGDLIRSSGKPFLCHVVGTASALEKEGAPLFVVRAGLLHAAFSHGRFADGAGGATQVHRRWLSERLGQDVEELIYSYREFRFNTDSIDAALAEPGSLGTPERTLFLMRLCNEVDDSLDFAAVLGGKPRYRGPSWMDRLQRLSLVLDFNFCAEALALAQAEIASSDWLETEQMFRHNYHPPGLWRSVKQALKNRGAWPEKRRA